MQVARASWMEEIGWAHQLRSGKRSMKIVAMLSSVKILRFGDLVKLYRIVRCLTMVLVYWTIFFKSVSGNLFGSFEIVLLSSFSVGRLSQGLHDYRICLCQLFEFGCLLLDYHLSPADVDNGL
ncbi:hypothetical protein QR680_006344 [Steinernema hermaphroditum]|uniref:Uncharacterized protein n=1 Tax=Steinernema hermaphroditum TaxID=289476 RepID=A0AA39HV79_9BILA|nr:hypothetical protein QR680_006344 [Steinernema hermaphroditum]